MADREKFKALIHYVCSQSPSLRSLGKVKLNKILWFAERDCYLRGEPISQVPFIKLQHGPVPRSMDSYLRELQSEGNLVVRETEWKGKPKFEFISVKEPSLAGFSVGQISLINKAIQGICRQHTADSISRLSHDEVWDVAEMGEEMPLYAAFGRPGELTEEDVNWASQQVLEIRA
ncbi:MAG TPA: Panacea domain-containing protein [Acidobacteriaceae bacterium]